MARFGYLLEIGYLALTFYWALLWVFNYVKEKGGFEKSIYLVMLLAYGFSLCLMWFYLAKQVA